MKSIIRIPLFKTRFQHFIHCSLIAVFFLLTPFLSKADSWEVYYNDSLIGTFSDTSDEVNLSFKSSVIKPTDKLVILYSGAGGACATCKVTVNIIDEKRRKVGGMLLSKDKKKMTCILGRLKEIAGSLSSETLYFYYTNEQDKFDAVILKVKIV